MWAAGRLEGEFSALGVDFAKRGAIMDEALETMMLAWSGREVVKRGLTFEARGNLPRPTPARSPAIWFGGAADKVLDRVVRWGAGWSPFFGVAGGTFRQAQAGLDSIPHLRERVDELRSRLEAARRTDPVDVCVNLLDPPKRMDRSEADRVLETLAALGEAGATWVFTGFEPASRQGFIEHAQWFGEEVIARVEDVRRGRADAGTGTKGLEPHGPDRSALAAAASSPFAAAARQCARN